MPEIIIPNRPIAGMENVGIHNPMRIGTCEEFGCEWFLYGRTGQDEGRPFAHPAGVRCGDFSRCQPCKSPPRKGALCGTCEPCKSGTANCPCPGRLARSLTNPNIRGHLVPDDSQELKFHHSPGVIARRPIGFNGLPNQHAAPQLHPDPTRLRTIGVSEFVDRLHEGVGTYEHILKHGR